MMPKQLQAARLRAANDRPYLSTALYALNPVEKPGLGTFAVDEFWRLYYDPKVIDVWNVEECAAVLIHEVGHLLRDHAARAKALHAPQSAWQIAADAAINDDLIKEGLPLPGSPILPKMFGGEDFRTEEEYLAQLLDQADKKPEPQPDPNGEPSDEETTADSGEDGDNDDGKQTESDDGEDGDEDSDDSGDGDDESEDGDGGGGEDDDDAEGDSSGGGDGDSAEGDANGPPGSDDSPQTGDTSGQDGKSGGGSPPQQPPKPSMGNCGSAADGAKREWEDGPPDDQNEGGLDRGEQDLVRRHVAKEIRESVKSRGDVPGHWQSWADNVLNPKIDWRRQFSGAVRSACADVAGKVDYRYGRPARRQSCFPDFIMPGMVQPVPIVKQIIDTSGSMSDRDLGDAINEAGGVLRACGFREGVETIACDSRIQAVKKVVSKSQLKHMGKGRGGTDMRVGMARAMEKNPKPHILVVFTDGGTPWPDVKPKGVTKVIVCLIGEHAYDSGIPDWCRVIRVPPPSAKKGAA